MLVYHRTTAAAAQSIQTHGFLDGLADYGSGRARAGVLFTESPSDEQDGARGDAVLTVELIGEDRHSLLEFAWADPDHRLDPSQCSEWIIPAEFVNRRAVIVQVDVREPTHW